MFSADDLRYHKNDLLKECCLLMTYHRGVDCWWLFTGVLSADDLPQGCCLLMTYHRGVVCLWLTTGVLFAYDLPQGCCLQMTLDCPVLTLMTWFSVGRGNKSCPHPTNNIQLLHSTMLALKKTCIKIGKNKFIILKIIIYQISRYFYNALRPPNLEDNRILQCQQNL
jgi:hypothetical protein